MDCIDFPVWKPTKHLRDKLDSIEIKSLYKAIRINASSFIRNPKVRRLILEKSNYKCVICGSPDNLQIDHIKSVWSFINKIQKLPELNAYDNLQLLCQSCNGRKKP